MRKPSKIYAETVDGKALHQFYSALSCDFAVAGALMPDAHTGYTLPIGAVVATDNVVVPAWVGYDIGCGMCALRTGLTRAEVEYNAERIFTAIYEEIPVGFNHHKVPRLWPEIHRFDLTPKGCEIWDAKGGQYQLGTLGGGNHFIEIGYDSTGYTWIIIHSGSRGIGHAIATHYMKLASHSTKAREGHFGLRADSPEGQDYLTDLNFGLEFALQSRKQMLITVGEILARCCQTTEEAALLWWDELINRNHNHAVFEHGMWIHRKGATHAEAGMMGVIPGNMRDGSFIVRGLGNEDALWSSSHGAGRVLGRRQAKEQLDLDDFTHTMANITAKVDASTLDESPAAYKNIDEVIDQQTDLIEVVCRVRPLINVKG